MNYEGETRHLAQVSLGSFLWAYLAPQGTDPDTITAEMVRERGSRL